MHILVLQCLLLMSYAGAAPDENKAKDIVNAMSTIDGHYKQDVLIIIAIESAFNEKATSNRGARGLMQLTKIAVKDVVNRKLCGNTKTPNDIYNLKTNIKIGGCFYEYLMLRYDKNKDEALSAYNGGHAAVMAMRKGKPFPETDKYLKRFKALEKKLNEATKGDSNE